MATGQRAKPSAQQELVFDAGQQEANEIREFVETLQPDEMTPKDALDALYRLKKKLRG
jgi:DNA mismatch repair ATPase MutS